MKLAAALTDAGGEYNEDAFGFVGKDADVTAAWVIDGVTGINKRNYLQSQTDASWCVAQVQKHLHELAKRSLPLQVLLDTLVTHLIADWRKASASLDLPADYDLPACCLLYVQHTPTGWQALRLGDSFLVSLDDTVENHPAPPSNLSNLEALLKQEALKRRALGHDDFKTLLAEFRPQLLANRKGRNRPGGYSILEPSRTSLLMPQIVELGKPSEILLCTDGFYRSVDHYGMHDDSSLMIACNTQHAANQLLQDMRELERHDLSCTRYPRFKPQDDATVLKLTR